MKVRERRLRRKPMVLTMWANGFRLDMVCYRRKGSIKVIGLDWGK